MIVEVMLHHFSDNAKWIFYQKYIKNAMVTLLES
jgi:hypothetical protein